MLTQPAGDESAAVFAPPPTSDIDHLVISCKQMDSSFAALVSIVRFLEKNDGFEHG